MRILAIHGVGHADAKTDWQDGWTKAITEGLRTWDAALAPEIAFLEYDALFERTTLNTPTVVAALARLTRSGLSFGLADRLRGSRGLGTVLEDARWTAGMLAQWVATDALRAKLRTRLAAKIRAFAPDVIAAHSLGSLIAYDTLRSDEVTAGARALSTDRTLVTFGSQIGNPAVRATFGGRVEGLTRTTFWWNLYNGEDAVFTAPIRLPNENGFREVEAAFDVAGALDHDGAHYLGHPQTTATLWQDLAARAGGRPLARRSVTVSPPAALATGHLRAARTTARTESRMRALLVGIAEYQDPSSNLEGPVNDVFSMSASLQELGFAADDIRVVLNDRATTQGIRERLRWLLADTRAGDQLVFFFAGHGAQIPGYGRDSEVDRLDECLVPYDFNWTRGLAITDDEFSGLYGQLPYGVQFTAILDCCHSGGLARAGGIRPRGLTPPDDIRHRSVRWDKTTQMWVPRSRLSGGAAGRSLRRKDDQARWLGKSGAVRRLGRGTSLWLPTDAAYKQATRDHGHRGPYTPILLEACREDELAYEYRHGVVSHGAFTFALNGVLRDAARAHEQRRRRLTFGGLVEEVARRVALVVSEPQHPQLQCTKDRLRQPIPGLA